MIPQAQGGSQTAIGTRDGRKIFPAVFQLAAFVSDYGITIDEAIRQQRLDVSGTYQVTVMAHTDETIIRKLAPSFPSRIIRPSDINPNLFALPQIIQRET